MKSIRITLFLGVFCCLLASCNKAHYDVSKVHGLNAEGEALLPIVHKTFTMMDMMERFHVDSIISCADDGSLSFDYDYEYIGVLSGDELLRFKDLTLTKHYEAENTYITNPPSFEDTTVSYSHAIVFEADHIGVLEAWMKSGHIEFNVASNIGVLQKVVIGTPDIEDSEGNDFMVEIHPQSDHFGIDLEGLHYHTDTANSLRLDFELHCAYVPTLDELLYVDLKIEGTDLAFREMTGYIEPYDSRNSIDTVFNLFSSNLSGVLDVKDVMLNIKERNTFSIGGRLLVDTALIMIDGLAPYSVFEDMPVVLDLPPQQEYTEVYSDELNGRIAPSGGSVVASALFTVNSLGTEEQVTITDTCSLDVQVSVMMPFSFNISQVQYIDTVDLNLSELELPDFIERLTLELTFTSTLPVNLIGRFYMYDSEHEMITDTLVSEGKLIEASFDGEPTHTTVSIDITEERLEKVLGSDRIIMQYLLDTDAHDVKLNANQKLTLYVKAKAKYNADVEFDN